MSARNLDEFVKSGYRNWQAQRFYELASRQSLLDQLFPRPLAKPLTLRERMARDLRNRADRLRDALRVLRGEAEIREDYDD